jgi:type IV pilus assembly protein PilB
MGVASFNIATSATLIIAQRLARRLCTGCKKQTDIPHETLLEQGFEEDQLGDLHLFEHNPEGCPRCNRGYRGRVGIYEMLEVSPAVAECIMENGSSLDILEVAKREGFATLRTAGLRKVAQGLTSLEEMNRVIKN